MEKIKQRTKSAKNGSSTFIKELIPLLAILLYIIVVIIIIQKDSRYIGLVIWASFVGMIIIG